MIGKSIHKLASNLWSINRSLTGEGVRQTLKLIKKIIPQLKIKKINSNTKVFDWVIPKEWKVKKAYILTPKGEKICDFKKNNLHLVGYSIPFKGKISLKKLQKHLHSIPSQKNAIPYVTSYYNKNWGFCISQKERNRLKDGLYKIIIDTELFNGKLNYGEIIIKGKLKKEIFLSTYICHPSMANNELSGPTVTTYLIKWLLAQKKLKYTYRIIFIPETIGSIAYLSMNYKKMKKNILAGFNVSCVGDDRAYSYLPSRDGNTLSDKVAKHILFWIDKNYKKYTWIDRGSDERQYCSPGIDLPIASIMRTKYGEYKEYHTSLDDLKNVVTPNGLEGGFTALKLALELIEKNNKFLVTNLCEPHMNKRNLYPKIPSTKLSKKTKLIMDFVSYCDGKKTLIEISDELKKPAWELFDIVKILVDQKIIKLVK